MPNETKTYEQLKQKVGKEFYINDDVMFLIMARYMADKDTGLEKALKDATVLSQPATAKKMTFIDEQMLGPNKVIAAVNLYCERLGLTNVLVDQGIELEKSVDNTELYIFNQDTGVVEPSSEKRKISEKFDVSEAYCKGHAFTFPKEYTVRVNAEENNKQVKLVLKVNVLTGQIKRTQT